MNLKVHVLAVVQSIKETWLDLSWAGFSLSQPNREVGKPLAAFTAQSYPHPSICLGIRAPPPCHLGFYLQPVGAESPLLWQEVSGELLSVSIGVV